MKNSWRWIKIIGVSVVIAAVLGAGIKYSSVFFGPGAEKLLNKAELAYVKGQLALNGGDAAAAALRFEEANLQANKTLDAVAQERYKARASGEEGTDLNQVEGKALWLKVRALRDQFVAKGIAEDKPMPETTDSVTGAKFHPVLAIPDNEKRQEALTCLHKAAQLLTDNTEVQRQLLLTELMQSPLNWNALEKIAQRALKIDAKDPWALYLLARFDFDQPSAVRATAPPKLGGDKGKDKRSKARVLQARQYVKQLKDCGSYPLWRTLYLEAEIAQWLRDDAARGDGKRRDSEEQTLRSLLFGPQGALARAKAGEGLEHPAKWDAEGVLGLHQLALGLAVEDSRQPGATTDKVIEILSATLALCRQLADKLPANVADYALSAVEALNKTELALAGDPPADWKKDIELAEALVSKARAQNVSNPLVYESIARLLVREAQIEGKRGNKVRRSELNKKALQWIEDGLRLGAEAKVPAAQLLVLNTQAAELKTIAGAKPEQVQVHLNALKDSKTPRGLALVALLEGTAAERAGRLAQARRLLEQVLASGQPDLAVQAHMVLGGVYLSLGQPNKALTSLQQVVQAYKVYDRLSPQEKAWAVEFIRGPEELALLMAIAHVEGALAQLRSFAQRYPDKPLSLDLVRFHETAVAELRKQFQKGTPQDRQLRQRLVVYYAATQRRDLAERELSELRLYYPNSVDVLRTEVDWIVGRAGSASPLLTKEQGADASRSPGFADADERIDQFIKDHPADLDARFFKVEWLIRTKRVADALAYLRSAAAFPDAKSERYQRVLAAVLLAKGDHEGSQKVLKHLPHDAATDAMLIEAASASEREKLVQQALARHEGNALFQGQQAVIAFNKGDYEGAAKAFLRAGQYQRYAEACKRGLLQSLLALAQSDPAKARSLAAQLYKETPEEPVLLLAAAFAALQLDEIGTPNDAPDSSGSMAAVLGAWEQMVLEQQPQAKTSAPLTKAEFWALAGRQDLALTEAARVLNIDPKDPAALRVAVALALELRNPDLRSATRKRLDTLRQMQPDNIDVLLLQARFHEWDEQPKAALAIYEALLKIDPKRNEAYGRMISLLIKQGDKDKAQDFVKQWQKEQPDNIAAVQMEVRLLAENKQAEQARKLAEAFIDKAKQSDAVRLNFQLQMIAALAQGKAWNAAEKWLNQLLAKYPDNLAILLRLGNVYIEQSSWDKARTMYEKVLAKDKNHGVAANNLAWLLAKHFNNAAAALPLAREARKGRFSHKPISGDRLRPEFLDTLGFVYTKMGKAALYPEMRDLFEAARQRYPHDPRMFMYLGHAYAGLLEPEQAERLYSLALEVARNTGPQFLSPEKCREVIAEVEAAQKKLKETAHLR